MSNLNLQTTQIETGLLYVKTASYNLLGLWLGSTPKNQRSKNLWGFPTCPLNGTLDCIFFCRWFSRWKKRLYRDFLVHKTQQSWKVIIHNHLRQLENVMVDLAGGWAGKTYRVGPTWWNVVKNGETEHVCEQHGNNFQQSFRLLP